MTPAEREEVGAASKAAAARGDLAEARRLLCLVAEAHPFEKHVLLTLAEQAKTLDMFDVAHATFERVACLFELEGFTLHAVSVRKHVQKLKLDVDKDGFERHVQLAYAHALQGSHVEHERSLRLARRTRPTDIRIDALLADVDDDAWQRTRERFAHTLASLTLLCATETGTKRVLLNAAPRGHRATALVFGVGVAMTPTEMIAAEIDVGAFARSVPMLLPPFRWAYASGAGDAAVLVSHGGGRFARAQDAIEALRLVVADAMPTTLDAFQLARVAAALGMRLARIGPGEETEPPHLEADGAAVFAAWTQRPNGDDVLARVRVDAHTLGVSVDVAT